MNIKAYLNKLNIEEYKNDKEALLDIVKLGTEEFKKFPEFAKKDKEIVMEAVKNNGGALQYASEDLQKDPEIRKLAEGEF